MVLSRFKQYKQISVVNYIRIVVINKFYVLKLLRLLFFKRYTKFRIKLISIFVGECRHFTRTPLSERGIYIYHDFNKIYNRCITWHM